MGIGEQFELEKTGRIEPETEQVLKTSDKAAKFVTGIEGWVDRHGRFFGKEEDMARWSGCTHIVCPDCDKATSKSYLRCRECREKAAQKRYEAKEHKLWDGEAPLYSELVDTYFFDDDLYDFLEDCRCSAESLQLVICDPIYLKEIDENHFCNELPEDGELPEDVIEMLIKLNKVIGEQRPISWMPGKYAAKIPLTD